jgi:polysaccharide biosynthesis/export protein
MSRHIIINQIVTTFVRLTQGDRSHALLSLVLFALLSPVLFVPLVHAANAAPKMSEPAQGDNPLLAPLGPGDSVSLQVYGQPDMNGTVYVADDGTINVPLVGHVHVAGLSPPEAGEQVQKALTRGHFLVDPHVTIAVVQSLSQRVVVLGEVRTPGRYAFDPHGGILDLLAQAGGVTEKGANRVFILHQDGHGSTTRTEVDLTGLGSGKGALPAYELRGGDSVLVPAAEQYYIYGEVVTPSMYRLEPGMTVIQAVARAGGITQRGSERRIEIKRLGKDGKYAVLRAKSDDLVQADDAIRVKESIF